MEEKPFWRRKTLARMTKKEWESLCDGCGRCCLNKIEEETSGRIYYTDVGCTLLDGQTCRCKDYPNRSEQVSDCVRLTPANLAEAMRRTGAGATAFASLLGTGVGVGGTKHWVALCSANASFRRCHQLTLTFLP